MKKLVVIIVICLASGLAMGWLLRPTQQEALDEALRAAEEIQAREAGLLVAKREAEADVALLAASNESLAEQIAAIADVVPEVKTREVVRWRTNEIRVPVETLVEVPVDRIVEISPDCPPIAPCDILEEDLAFEVRGVEARLESRRGNLFAVGDVELWLTDPPPERFLGSSTWNTPMTEMTASSQSEAKTWRMTAMLGLSSTPGVWGGLAWQRRSRFGWMALVEYGDPDNLEVTCDYRCHEEKFVEEGDRWTVLAGATYNFGRR